ncbi:tubulin polymerization-promoting protein isoform X1 [Tachysurus ichikawai]
MLVCCSDKCRFELVRQPSHEEHKEAERHNVSEIVRCGVSEVVSVAMSGAMGAALSCTGNERPNTELNQTEGRTESERRHLVQRSAVAQSAVCNHEGKMLYVVGVSVCSRSDR